MHSPCIEHSKKWYIKKLLGQRLMYKYEGNVFTLLDQEVTRTNVDVQI